MLITTPFVLSAIPKILAALKACQSVLYSGLRLTARVVALPGKDDMVMPTDGRKVRDKYATLIRVLDET